MSYHSEHQRMKPVLDMARQLDIATNPHPSAVFEAGNGGFQVWCTPEDHPQGWNGISMIPGAFSKPCEYVGSVRWKWDNDKIEALTIETTAYALAEQKPDEYRTLKEIPEGFSRRTICNRDVDIEWLKEKVTWLFATASVPLPPFEYEQTSLSDLRPYLLAYYETTNDEYVVIVSPSSDPKQFCRAGYQVVCTLEIGNATVYPADVILRPDQEHLEAMIERKPAPVLGQAQTCQPRAGRRLAGVGIRGCCERANGNIEQSHTGIRECRNSYQRSRISWLCRFSAIRISGFADWRSI